MNPSTSFYTGTVAEPDTTTLFNKCDGHYTSTHFSAPTNELGTYPVVSSVTGSIRIWQSASKVFNAYKLKDDNFDHWNAFKNFIRGLLEFVPIIGNFSVFLVDKARSKIYCDPQIQNRISGENSLSGFAYDGKVVFALTHDQMNQLYPIFAEQMIRFVNEMPDNEKAKIPKIITQINSFDRSKFIASKDKSQALAALHLHFDPSNPECEMNLPIKDMVQAAVKSTLEKLNG